MHPIVSFLLVQIELVDQHHEWSKIEEEAEVEDSRGLEDEVEESEEANVLWIVVVHYLFEGKDILEALPYLMEATNVSLLQVPIEVFEGNEAKDKK